MHPGDLLIRNKRNWCHSSAHGPHAVPSHKVLVGLGLVLAFDVFVADLSAEVIHIPVGEQALEFRDLPRPVRGMSQETVLTSFGEPHAMTAPIGNPPISKWSYEKFTVYFESSTVIHSVLTHIPKYPTN